MKGSFFEAAYYFVQIDFVEVFQGSPTKAAYFSARISFVEILQRRLAVFATLSDENRILKIISDHDLSLQFVSGLAQQAGIPRCSFQTLSVALKAGRGLRDTGPSLLKLLHRLDDFAKKYRPVKVEFSNTAEVYGWMEAERKGELHVLGERRSAFIEGLLSGLGG